MKKANSCKYYQSLISGAISNEITPKEAFYLKLHLEKCTSCSTEYAQYSSALSKFSVLKNYYKELEKQGLPEEIFLRIQNNIKQKIRNKKVPKFYIYSKPIYTAVLLLLLSFVYLFTFENPTYEEKNNNSNWENISSVPEFTQDNIPKGFCTKLDFDDERMNPTSEVIVTNQDYFLEDSSKIEPSDKFTPKSKDSENSDIYAEPFEAQPYIPEFSGDPSVEISPSFDF